MDDRPDRFFYGWIVLAVGVGVVFGSLGLARFGYTLVLPAMQHGLGIANTEAGALATANLVGYLLLSAVGGALAARFGPRTVISIGLALARSRMRRERSIPRFSLPGLLHFSARQDRSFFVRNHCCLRSM